MARFWRSRVVILPRGNEKQRRLNTKGGGENVRTNRRIIDHVVDCKMV